jgi:hypothetical protein
MAEDEQTLLTGDNKKKVETFFSSLTERERTVLAGLDNPLKKDILDMVCKDSEMAHMFLVVQVKALDEPSPREEAVASAKRTAKMIERGIKPVQQSLPVIAPYPHDITRQSMFFIESSTGERKISVRDMLNDAIIGVGSWGNLKITGPRLYIRDEKILLIIFHEIAENIRLNKHNPYIVSGNMSDLLKKAGLSTGGHYYRQVRDSLEHMGKVTFSLNGNLAGSKKKKRSLDPLRQYHLVKTDIDTLGDDDTATYSVRADPRFFETFISEFSLYQRIDVKLYCSLPPVAAAIYRFFNSHDFTSGRKVFSMLMVAKVINLMVDEDWPAGADNSEWPDAKVKSNRKETIKSALKKLVQAGVFVEAFIKAGRRGEDDTVIVLERAQKKIKS